MVPGGGDDLEGREEQGDFEGRWRRFQEAAGDLNVFTSRPRLRSKLSEFWC